ncbi:hypothetical protein [Pararhizobium gei]|uniref:hypothetical protein n=1 Tax=Pararhizobium gei TaxID=1395951 RepID=UPI0023DBA009|nr:hypothetical protein [Rhizobium gei]
MPQLLQNGVRWLDGMLADLNAKSAKGSASITSTADSIALRNGQAPAKRTAATNIRALVAGGTISNPIVLAELTADATKLDADANKFDAYVEQNLPVLAQTQSYVAAVGSVIASLATITTGPTALTAFTFTSKTAGHATFSATTSANAKNALVTLWRMEEGEDFDSNKAVLSTSTAATPSTTYSLTDGNATLVPAGTWDFFAVPSNTYGYPGPVSGPVRVTVS